MRYLFYVLLLLFLSNSIASDNSDLLNDLISDGEIYRANTETKQKKRFRDTVKFFTGENSSGNSFTFSADCYGYCSVRKITLSGASASWKSLTTNSVSVGESALGKGLAGTYQYSVELEVGENSLLFRDNRQRRLCAGSFSTDGSKRFIKITLKFDSCEAEISQY